MRPYYYMGGNWALTQLSTGAPFFVNTDDRAITPWIVMGGTWENFVDDVLCGIARPGEVFLDIGANLGYYAVKVGRIVGASGRVYAFEPNSELFPFVRENIAINGMRGWAEGFPLAVGAEPGWSVLNFNYSNMGGGHVAQPEHARSGGDGQVVPIARVDDLIRHDRPVDLIKIDVEGFEPLALRGMQRILAASPKASIVTEVSVPQWRRFGEPMDILKPLAAGRRIFFIRETGQLEEYSLDALPQVLNPAFVSYVLLATPEHVARLTG